VRVLVGPSSSSTSKLQTHPLVREGVPHKNIKNLKILLWKGNKNWSQVPDGGLIPEQPVRLTDGSKIASNLPICGRTVTFLVTDVSP
jgi:hypothetical protein